VRIWLQSFQKVLLLQNKFLVWLLPQGKKNAEVDDAFESVEMFQKVRGRNSFAQKTKR
jgi:hypothetical protein